MHEKLGDGYEKYTYIGHYQPKSVESESSSKGISRVAYGSVQYNYRGCWSGYYTDESVGVVKQPYTVYSYTRSDASWFTYPWGSYNVAGTFRAYRGHQDTSELYKVDNFLLLPTSSQTRTFVQDKVTSGYWGNWQSADNESALTFGSLMSGIFPAGPSNFISKHEELDNKLGDTVVTYSWN